jgi:fucose permease
MVNKRVLALLAVFFFVSLVSNVLGPLLPDVIQTFHLSLTMAAFLPFSFFAAYAVMSIPSGFAIELWGEKPMLIAAFALQFAAAFLFCIYPNYPTALLSLFLIGVAMAALQVAINPLLRVSGGEENYAFNAVLAQLVFGLASFISPLIYTQLSSRLNFEPRFISIYWLVCALALLMATLVSFVSVPKVERKDDEKVGAIETHKLLLRDPKVWLFFVGIFSYVGLEQGLSNWISEFLHRVHGLNPDLEGAHTVAGFWGMMVVGCVVGLFLLKFLESRKVLIAFSGLALLFVTLGIWGTAPMAMAAFPLAGFSLSVMWSIIFALALNSMPKHQGTFSGILCTGIVGGAIVPLLVGAVADATSFQIGLSLLYLPLLFISSIGFWAISPSSEEEYSRHLEIQDQASPL